MDEGGNTAALQGLSAEELLQRPVRLNGIYLGRPVDLVFDTRGSARAIGFEVLCGDDSRRFLPLAAASLRHDQIGVDSTLALLERAEFAFYRERGSTLKGLRGSLVSRAGEVLGLLEDIEVGSDGAVQHVLVANGHGEERVAYDPSLELRARSSAA